MGRNELDKSGQLSIFTSLKHLIVLLRCNFFKASFVGLHIIKDTDIACRDMHAAQIFESENIVKQCL